MGVVVGEFFAARSTCCSTSMGKIDCLFDKLGNSKWPQKWLKKGTGPLSARPSNGHTGHRAQSNGHNGHHTTGRTTDQNQYRLPKTRRTTDQNQYRLSKTTTTQQSTPTTCQTKISVAATSNWLFMGTKENKA